jgi:hypothetical protein
MKFFNTIRDMMKALSNLPPRATVWRGEDGSYAVGESFPLEYEDDPSTEYVEAGKVDEYARP